MIQVLFFVGLGLAGLVGLRLLLPIVDWYKGRNRNEEAEFISDLYKLQQKWTKRGFFDKSRAIGMIITSFTLKDEEVKAKTEYGREIQKALKEINTQEG